jgi:hypothetical protein
MTSVQHTALLEQLVSSLSQLHQQSQTEENANDFVRDGLACLLQLHMQYVSDCKQASTDPKKVMQQKLTYENSLLSLQNKRRVFQLYCAVCVIDGVADQAQCSTLSPCRVEKLFYERMINSNRAYKSHFQDESIDLLGEDEFRSQLPEDEQATLADADDAPHELMKRRLRDEASKREELQKRKLDLEQIMQQLQVIARLAGCVASPCSRLTSCLLQNENKVKRQKLESSKAHMELIVASAKPAFRHLSLGPLHSVDTGSIALFSLLHPKLQCLYHQLVSATAVCSMDAQVCLTTLQALALDCVRNCGHTIPAYEIW